MCRRSCSSSRSRRTASTATSPARAAKLVAGLGRDSEAALLLTSQGANAPQGELKARIVGKTFLGAATVSRAYVDNGKLWVLLASLALYCLGNLMMVKLMREGGLGLAISASAIAQLVLINVIAFFLFGERLSAVQTAGVALGVVSMALMLFPAKGGA